jgi:hypothetical protein
MSKALVWTSFLLMALTAWIPPVIATAANGSASIRWNCPVPMLRDYKDDVAGGTDVGEGISYLYDGDKHLRSNYGADALFTAPIDGRQGWYDTALRLGPYAENNGFVQVEISRWKRFDYKQHVAVAWSVPHGSVVEHRDTGLMLADGVPHRLGIFVRDGLLRMFVDGRLLCSTHASNFVASSERKYFQVRTETSVVGSNGLQVCRTFASNVMLTSAPGPLRLIAFCTETASFGNKLAQVVSLFAEPSILTRGRSSRESTPQSRAGRRPYVALPFASLTRLHPNNIHVRVLDVCVL